MNKKIILIKLFLLSLFILNYSCKGQQEVTEISLNVNNYETLIEKKVNDSIDIKIYQLKKKHIISLVKNQKIIDTVEVITSQSNTAFSSLCEKDNKKFFAIVYDKCYENKYEVAQVFNINEKNNKIVKLPKSGVVCSSEIPCDSNEDYINNESNKLIQIQSRTNWRLDCKISDNFYFDEDMISQLTIKDLFSLSVTLIKNDSNIYEIYLMEFSPLISLSDDIENLNIEKTEPIATIELKGNDEIEFYWLGFLDKTTMERKIIENPFDGNKNPVILRKCE